MKAKGWRFELDYEQIEQSDTWPLAAEVPMAQHALLMMWLVAWKQVPCGSFPNDHEVIRAKCRIPAETWAVVQPVLMRGWWLASDGRLYHDTIAKRVVEMIGRRRSDADRQAAKRMRDAKEAQEAPKLTSTHGDVTRDSTVTPTEVRSESSTDHRLLTKDISKPSASHPPAGGLAAGFNDFWLAWPKGERKQDKAKCLDHWKRNNLRDVADLILADVRVKRGTVKWSEGFIEAPLVYLRGRRWEDGVEPETPAPAAHALTVPSAAAAHTADALAEMAAAAALANTPEARAARLAAMNKLRGLGVVQQEPS